MPHKCTRGDTGAFKRVFDASMPNDLYLRRGAFNAIRHVLADIGGGTLIPVAKENDSPEFIARVVRSVSCITLLLNVQKETRWFRAKINGAVTNLELKTGHMLVAGPDFVFTPAGDDHGVSGHIHVTLMSQSVADEMQGLPYVWPLRRAALMRAS